MTQQYLHVPAGKMFCISSGEYSDYGYRGHFLALVEITPEMFAKVVDECIAAQKIENVEGGWDIGGSNGASEKFIPMLIRSGWVMDIDCVEIHMGSYGELDLS